QCDRASILQALAGYGKAHGMNVRPEQAAQFSDLELVNLLGVSLPFHPAEKQALLEAPSLKDREKMLVNLLQLGAAPLDAAAEAAAAEVLLVLLAVAAHAELAVGFRRRLSEGRQTLFHLQQTFHLEAQVVESFAQPAVKARVARPQQQLHLAVGHAEGTVVAIGFRFLELENFFV